MDQTQLEVEAGGGEAVHVNAILLCYILIFKVH